MAFEHIFQTVFDKATNQALSAVCVALFVRVAYTTLQVLLSTSPKNSISTLGHHFQWLQMVKVLNLVVFTVTIGSQLMALAFQYMYFVLRHSVDHL